MKLYIILLFVFLTPTPLMLGVMSNIKLKLIFHDLMLVEVFSVCISPALPCCWLPPYTTAL